MRNNQPVNNNEVSLKDNASLVSSTNLKGVITHCNDAFVNISGFSHNELIGAPHNLVRHPDMPEVAFSSMWQTLKSGQHWLGMVKNRTKDGGFYWVDAYVTPLQDNGEIIGYESVRVKPSREQITRAEKAYKTLRQKRSPFPIAHRWRPLIPQLAIWGALIAAMAVLKADWLVTSGALIAAFASILIQRQTERKLGMGSTNVINDELMAWIYTGHFGSQGAIEFALYAQRRRLQTVLVRIADNADHLKQATLTTLDLSGTTLKRVKEQHSHTQAVGKTSHHIQAIAKRILDNSNSSAAASSSANTTAQQGLHDMGIMVTQTESLQGELRSTAEAVSRLTAEVQAVNRFLQAISDIAEQTNLLALNAAIEAARAGDQGRGFAVVADEVRNLARRTQESAAEIQTIVNGLNQHSEFAVEAMKQGEQSTDHTLELAQKITDVFANIRSGLNDIKHITDTNRDSVDEQSRAAESIHNNLSQLEALAQDAESLAGGMNKECDNLALLMNDQNQIIHRFQQGI